MTELVRRAGTASRATISPAPASGVERVSARGSDIIRPGTRAPGFLGPTNVSSLPQVINITTYQGDDLYLYIVIWDHDGQPAHDPDTLLDALVRELIEAAPPLTGEQRRALALLLRGPGQPGQMP